MRILVPLFSPPTGTLGGLTRVLAIENAAKIKGHNIAFCASGHISEILIKKGFKVYKMPEPTMFGLPKIVSNFIKSNINNINLPIKPGRTFGSIWHIMLISGFSNFKYLKKLVKMQLEAANNFMPDILFTELDPGAFVISEILNIPIASTFASIMKTGINTFPYKKISTSINKIFNIYGKQKKDIFELFFGSKVLKIIPSIPELEQNIPISDEYVFCGALIHSFVDTKEESYKFDLKNEKSYVYVYMGTGSIPQNILFRVLPELFPINSKVVCLVGGIQNNKDKIKIGNVIFKKNLDAEHIIPKCDWVICHGGLNTIIQSLKYGIPLVIFPGAIFERRFNALMVRNYGAGELGEKNNFNSKWLSEIFSKREKYAKKAAELSIKIQSLNGAYTAIESMEKFINLKRN